MNDIPRGGLGHNRPPEPIEEARPKAEREAVIDASIEAFISSANKWVERHPVIETEELAKLALDELNKLRGRRAEYEALRKAEKKEWDDGAKAVQRKWLPRLERIEACLKVFERLRSEWLQLKTARQEAEREAGRKEAEEAQRRADQLAEQAKAGGPGTVTNLINATEAAQEAERKREAAAAIPTRAQSRGTLGGPTHSLRATWHAEVIEPDLLYQRFRDHPDVLALFYRLANAAVRAANGPRPEGGAKSGVSQDLPGCWIYSEVS